MRATIGVAMRVLVVDDGIMQAIDGRRGWTRAAGISMSESGEYAAADGTIMAP